MHATRTLALAATLTLAACGGAPPAAHAGHMASRNAIAPSKPHPHLTYRGGPLVAAARYTNIYWGPYWTSDAGKTDADHYDSFMRTMASSARFMSVTQEYSRPEMPIGVGSFNARVLVPQGPAPKIVDGDIRAMIDAQLRAGAVPYADANQVYVVYLPPGVVVDAGGGEVSCDKICGYHWTFWPSSGDHQVLYIVLPHPDCWGCRFATLHDGIDMDDLNRDSTTIIASHEMIETVTDPLPGQGWYDDANMEIGDICGGNSGWFDNGELLGFRIQKQWSNADDGCQLERTIPLPQGGGCPAGTHQSGGVCQPDVPAGCSTTGGAPGLLALAAGLLLLRRRRAA